MTLGALWLGLAAAPFTMIGGFESCVSPLTSFLVCIKMDLKVH